MKNHSMEDLKSLTPARSLEFLREGNERFRANLKANHDLLQQANACRAGQFPFAAVLSCIDSRTSAELIFDQGFGDIFSIRIAGTIVNEDILGSMEYACKVAGSRLLVVLGHTHCGAIKGACDGLQLGNLSTLLNKIQPSVYFERTVREQRNASNPEFVRRVTEIHVHRSLEAIVERSLVIRQLVERGEVGLIGAMYDLGSGQVQFLDHTWMCGEIKHFFRSAEPVDLRASA